MKWSYSFGKYVFTLLLLIFMFASNHVTPTAGQENSLISIDRASLEYEEEVTVKFENVLGRKIAVITTGCGLKDGGYLPKLTIEKQENESWMKAGSPICIAIATPPINLMPGESKSVTFSVGTGLKDSATNGRFRYVFDIRTEREGKYPPETKVSREHRISPPFTIQNKN